MDTALGSSVSIEPRSSLVHCPVLLLIFHPIIQISSILSGINYGIIYTSLSTFSNLCILQYGQFMEVSGLHYIACSLGELGASQIGGRLMDHLSEQRQGNSTPESRIPLMYLGIITAWGRGIDIWMDGGV